MASYPLPCNFAFPFPRKAESTSPSCVSEFDLIQSIKWGGENFMPISGLALRGVACFCSFSLAPLPSPWEGHPQASLLEDERHVEQGRVPLVALAEANLQALTDSQLQNMPVSPAKISRTTPSALQTREINSYYIPWRFRGHLLHSVLVATGNSYMVPVLKKKKKKLLINRKIYQVS